MLKALAKLRKRALSSGVSKEAVEGALDLGDPKAGLVSLVVARRMELGAVGDLVEKLRGGGEDGGGRGRDGDARECNRAAGCSVVGNAT